MKMDATCDAYSYVPEIYKELRPVFRKAEEKYNFPLEIFTVFRLLSEQINRKTKISYSKKENILWIDLVVSGDKYEKLKKPEQRHDLSQVYFDTLATALRKYKFKELDTEAFLKDFEKWLTEIGWRKEEWEVAMEAMDT
ncbi:MAG: hypothetical protein WCI11_18690 [Candidatus Methylumidiphilus sp.]